MKSCSDKQKCLALAEAKGPIERLPGAWTSHPNNEARYSKKVDTARPSKATGKHMDGTRSGIYLAHLSLCSNTWHAVGPWFSGGTNIATIHHLMPMSLNLTFLEHPMPDRRHRICARETVEN